MESSVGLLRELDRNTFPAYSKERATSRCRGRFEKGRDRMRGGKTGVRSGALLLTLERTCLADLLLELTGKGGTMRSLLTRGVLSGARGELGGLCVRRSCDSRRKSALHHRVWTRHGVSSLSGIGSRHCMRNTCVGGIGLCYVRSYDGCRSVSIVFYEEMCLCTDQCAYVRADLVLQFLLQSLHAKVGRSAKAVRTSVNSCR
jgi:hypothetical protein